MVIFFCILFTGLSNIDRRGSPKFSFKGYEGSCGLLDVGQSCWRRAFPQELGGQTLSIFLCNWHQPHLAGDRQALEQKDRMKTSWWGWGRLLARSFLLWEVWQCKGERVWLASLRLGWPAISKLSWQLQTDICVTGSPWKPREGELEALWGIKPIGKALVWGWDCSTSPRKRLLTLEGEPKVPVPLQRPRCSLDAVCAGWKSGSPSVTWSCPREQWSEMWSSSSIPTDTPSANPINFIS